MESFFLFIYFMNLQKKKKKNWFISFETDESTIKIASYELVDQEIKILTTHICNCCKLITIYPFECDDGCCIYWENHFPEDRKCPECNGQLKLNKKKQENIYKRYLIKYIRCSSTMSLSEWSTHKKESCKKKCPQKCEEMLTTRRNWKSHQKWLP